MIIMPGKRQDYLGAVDHIILEQIGRRNPCSYLDVGCGTGRMLSKIQQAFPASRGFGIDISSQMVETCRAKGLDVTQADFFAFQPATTFDVVFLEFNVFGYLIVQNGLEDSIRHLRRLLGDRVVFDILNPFCLTYVRLRRTLPTAIGRCCNLLAKGGECQFTYSIGGTPIAMGLAWSGRIESGFRAAGYKVSRHAIKWAAQNHRSVSAGNTVVTLRLMTERDLPTLHDWLNRPHIVEWWGGEEERPTLDEVLEHYLPRVMAEDPVAPYIAMLGEEPIGYAQTYVALGSVDGWWEDETDPGVRGIDQSLANPTQLNNGLGTQLVRALVELLFSDPTVTKIQTDPAPNNHRAIRCYEKAGFVQQKVITTPDGLAVCMAQTRHAFESARGAASRSTGPATEGRLGPN